MAYIPLKTRVYNDNQCGNNIIADFDWESGILSFIMSNAQTGAIVRTGVLATADINTNNFVHAIGDTPVSVGLQNTPPGSNTWEIVAENGSGEMMHAQLRVLDNATISALYRNEQNAIYTQISGTADSTALQILDSKQRSITVNTAQGADYSVVAVGDLQNRGLVAVLDNDSISISDAHRSMAISTTENGIYINNANGAFKIDVLADGAVLQGEHTVTLALTPFSLAEYGGIATIETEANKSGVGLENRGAGITIGHIAGRVVYPEYIMEDENATVVPEKEVLRTIYLQLNPPGSAAGGAANRPPYNYTRAIDLIATDNAVVHTRVHLESTPSKFFLHTYRYNENGADAGNHDAYSVTANGANLEFRFLNADGTSYQKYVVPATVTSEPV